MKVPLRSATLILTCLLIYCSGLAINRERSKVLNENRPIETVHFCDLAKHPELYTGRSIATTAIFVTAFPDVWFMCDEQCLDKDYRISYSLNCKPNVDCEYLKRAMSAHLVGDGERFRNRMTVLGELRVENRQKAPKKILKFYISDVQSKSDVPREVLWPW